MWFQGLRQPAHRRDTCLPATCWARSGILRDAKPAERVIDNATTASAREGPPGRPCARRARPAGGPAAPASRPAHFPGNPHPRRGWRYVSPKPSDRRAAATATSASAATDFSQRSHPGPWASHAPGKTPIDDLLPGNGRAPACRSPGRPAPPHPPALKTLPPRGNQARRRLPSFARPMSCASSSTPREKYTE